MAGRERDAEATTRLEGASHSLEAATQDVAASIAAALDQYDGSGGLGPWQSRLSQAMAALQRGIEAWEMRREPAEAQAALRDIANPGRLRRLESLQAQAPAWAQAAEGGHTVTGNGAGGSGGDGTGTSGGGGTRQSAAAVAARAALVDLDRLDAALAAQVPLTLPPPPLASSERMASIRHIFSDAGADADRQYQQSALAELAEEEGGMAAPQMAGTEAEVESRAHAIVDAFVHAPSGGDTSFGIEPEELHGLLTRQVPEGSPIPEGGDEPGPAGD